MIPRTFKMCLVVLVAVGTNLVLCAPASAYADPNAGGLLFQLLTPIVALAWAGVTFARAQLQRLWSALLAGIKTLAARLFRA